MLHDNHRNYSKDVPTFGTLRLFLGNGLFTSDGDFWRRQRRLAQPAFHRRRVAAFGELMTQATEEMLERWQVRVHPGQLLDVATEFMRLTMEVVTRALFSTSVEHDIDKIGSAIATLLDDVTFRFTFPFYPPPRVPTPRNRRFLAARATLDGIVYQIIAERRRRPAEHEDLLALLMEARDEETGELVAETELAYAVRDAFPVTPLHTLVIPKRHVSVYFELGRSELNACHRVLEQEKAAIEGQDASGKGFNVGMNEGETAGQSVFHCHLHVIPRRRGDVEDPTGIVRNVIPGKGIYR